MLRNNVLRRALYHLPLSVMQVKIQGVMADEWTIRGLQPNNYYATADAAAVPLQLDQLPNDYITFDKESYSQGRVPPSAFDLPDFVCADRCPLISVCSLLKLSGSLRSGVKQVAADMERSRGHNAVL